MFELIIWSNKGGLVVLSTFLKIYISVTFFNLLPVDTSYEVGYIFQGIFALAMSALINYLFTKKFVPDKLRSFIDKETGERILIKDGSSLFQINIGLGLS